MHDCRKKEGFTGSLSNPERNVRGRFGRHGSFSTFSEPHLRTYGRSSASLLGPSSSETSSSLSLATCSGRYSVRSTVACGAEGPAESSCVCRLLDETLDVFGPDRFLKLQRHQVRCDPSCLDCAGPPKAKNQTCTSLQPICLGTV